MILAAAWLLICCGDDSGNVTATDSIEAGAGSEADDSPDGEASRPEPRSPDGSAPHDAKAPAAPPSRPADAASPTPPSQPPGDAGMPSGRDAAVSDARVPDAAEPMTQDGGPRPDPKFLVPATGPCPEFRDGYVMFSPDGKPRRVLLYATDRPNMNGPLLFSWHSTLPNPEDTVSWVGRSVIDQIKAQGGVVVAPTTADRSARRPWDNTPLGPANSDADQRLMDEVVACAIQKLGIDVRRIHSTGMSAGGQKTAQVSLRRSGYLASVVVYSGGLPEGSNPPDQDPNNPVAAMILYGGRSDISPVDGENYTAASTRYRDSMVSKGRFAFLCNHGGGHTVPNDAQASAWRFLQDHPFGTKPSPYAAGLPSGFVRYCSLD